MKLSVGDRFAIEYRILLGKGNLNTIRITADIRKRISVTEKEKVEIKYEEMKDPNDPNRILGATWDRSIADGIVKDFSFSNAELSLMRDRIKELDKSGELVEQDLDVLEKILRQGEDVDGLRGGTGTH